LNQAAFNGNTLTGSAKGSGANYDNSLFVSKISPSKTTLWTLKSDVGVVTPIAMATTAAGDLYLTATIRPVVGGTTTNANVIDAVGTVTTFTGLYSSTSIVQSIVVKFNAAGVVQWVKEFNSGTAKDKNVTTTSLTTDAVGNVYVSGTFANTVVLPGTAATTLTSPNTTLASFIAKLDATDGNTLWSKASTLAVASENIAALTTGDDGYIYAAGITQNTASATASLGSTNYSVLTGYNLLLARISTDGVIDYIQVRSNALDTRIKDLVVNKGKAYVGGSFKSTSTSGIALTSGNYVNSTTTAYLNGYLLAFESATGADLWQKTVVAPGISEINGLAVGADSLLYAFGYHYNAIASVPAGSVDFGNSVSLSDTETSNKSGDLFLSSYNLLSGTTQGAHLVASGPGSETSNSLTSYNNKLYLLGTTNSATMTYENSTTYSTYGAYDFFLAAYTVTPVSTYLKTETGSNNIRVYADKSAKSLIVSNMNEISELKLFDAVGKLVAVSNVRNKQSVNINIQDLKSGVYFIQAISAKGNVYSQKVLLY